MRHSALLAVALAGVSVAACGSTDRASAPQTKQGRSRTPAVREVKGVDQLRTLFNAQSEKPRLIVLASPT